MTVEFICKWLAENLEPPYSYTINGVDVCATMHRVDGGCDWCDKNCGCDVAECWKRYFEIIGGNNNEQSRSD